MNNQRPVLLITGAAGGIGSATCLEFAHQGYDLAIADLPGDLLEEVAKQANDLGAKTLLLPGDLTDFDYVETLVPETTRCYGKIDTLVNNAAWREVITMQTISLDSWEKTIRIGLTVPAFLSRFAAQEMKKQNQGVIINVSSIQSEQAAGISPAYVASKGGLDALTYELATLWGPSGIRVLAVNPGAIDTAGSSDYESEQGESLTRQQRQWSEDMIPLQRWGKADEVAKTIAMLASEQASYITGTTIVVDGGIQTQFSPYRIKQQMFPEEYSHESE